MTDATDTARSIAVIAEVTDITPTAVNAPIAMERARKIAPTATAMAILKKRRTRTNIAAEATVSAILVKGV